MDEHPIDIAVIINGQPIALDQVAVKAVLRTIVERALSKSGNSGQPVDNWELRDANGQILDLQKTVEHYGIIGGAKLFLNLKAGVGG